MLHMDFVNLRSLSNFLMYGIEKGQNKKTFDAWANDCIEDIYILL